MKEYRQEKIQTLLGEGRKRGSSLLIPGGRTWSEHRREMAGAESHRELLQEIQAEAERLLASEEPLLTDALFNAFEETGERLSYERVYFEKRKRLNSFAIMTLLHPDSLRYSSALEAAVLAICEERTWCLPAHYKKELGPNTIDLFAAETGFAMAEISALLGDGLPGALRERMTEETERRILAPFLSDGPYHWERLENNWSAVCAGSVGSAALYLVDDNERLSTILARVMEAMRCFFDGYGNDGACTEGYGYWQYGFGFYTYFAALLKESTEGRIDGFEGEKLRQIALFQQRAFSSGHTIINFSDSNQRSGVFMGLSSYLHDLFDEVAIPNSKLRAPYAEDHCGRWAHAIRNLVWVKPSDFLASGDWPVESHYLQDAAWLMSRSTDEQGHTYCFAAKGGHNGESHNHNDCGHFILHASEDVLLADLGSGMYTKQYFGSERYEFWCNGSQGHSLPIVNGSCQAAGKEHRAVVRDASVEEARSLFTVELTEAYPAEAGLKSFIRSFEWRTGNQPTLLLHDSIVMREDIELDRSLHERFILIHKPEMLEPGKLKIGGEVTLNIIYDSEQWKAEVTMRTDKDHSGEDRSWYTLDFIWLGEASSGRELEASFVFQFAG
ncbi:heparinase II/III family protein [Paenibacillus sp. HB172176]|uniref:heparinase II/III family protein n=1 Tax=Paenibacillus sp. HB172176 TaxID=2493690 RepID=UPI00143B7016|nr:heparinase II/III family protein [Paenibacillus sp. HB172176]